MWHHHHSILVDIQTSWTDILTMLAAIVAAGVAVYGVREWKRQLKGKTDYEVARRYLKDSLKLRDAIKFVRNPFIPVSEMQASLKEFGLNSEEYKDNQKTNRAVYNVRWKKVIEAWTSLEAVILDAEVSWGKESIEIQKPLDLCVRELRAAIEMYLQGHSERGEEKLIYDMGEGDEFSKKVEKAIQEIKEYLKPHLA